MKKVEAALEKMDRFSRTKKNMHLTIRDGIREALKELKVLRRDMEKNECYLDSLEYLLRGRMVSRIREVGSPKKNEVLDEDSQTLPQPTMSIPDIAEGADNKSEEENQQTGGGKSVVVITTSIRGCFDETL